MGDMVLEEVMILEAFSKKNMEKLPYTKPPSASSPAGVQRRGHLRVLPHRGVSGAAGPLSGSQ